MPQRRFFQRFWRRDRPPWHKLPEGSVLVVALPQGLQVDNDLFVPCGGVVPRDRFQEHQLRALYDWRRIDAKPPGEAVAEAPPPPPVAVRPAKSGPLRPPVAAR